MIINVSAPIRSSHISIHPSHLRHREKKRGVQHYGGSGGGSDGGGSGCGGSGDGGRTVVDGLNVQRNAMRRRDYLPKVPTYTRNHNRDRKAGRVRVGWLVDWVGWVDKNTSRTTYS